MTDTKSLLPTFLRKRIEMACDNAENPKGMSVHDGMARIHAADIRRLLLVIDHLAKPAGMVMVPREPTPTRAMKGTK